MPIVINRCGHWEVLVISTYIVADKVWHGGHVAIESRVPHGYGDTRGVSKMGNTGSGTV